MFKLSTQSAVLMGLVLMSMSSLIGGCDEKGGITQAANPDLRVTPNPIFMSAVGVGQTSTQVVRARNAGDGRLQIVGLVFSNSLSGLEFTKEHPELPIYLGPDEEIEITVNYTPQDPNPDQGKLIFESNSIQGQVTQVDIITEEGRSDLFFAPESTFSLNVCDTEMLQNVPFQSLPPLEV